MVLSGKKILIAISPEGFRDEEFFETYSVMKNLGAAVTIASTSLADATSMQGKKVRANISLISANAPDYNAVIFIGGTGLQKYFKDNAFLSLASQANQTSRLIGAIGTAPAILANAGVLDGKSATSFLTVQGHLITSGADYTGRDLEVSGNIVTAKDRNVAREFAMRIAELLSKSQ